MKQFNKSDAPAQGVAAFAQATLGSRTNLQTKGPALFTGDPDEEGDINYSAFIGDAEEETGEPFETAAETGDAELEEGGPFKGVRKALKNRKSRRAVAKANRNAKKHPVAAAQSNLKTSRTLAGKINSEDDIKFVTAKNFIIQSITQFNMQAGFKGRSLKFALDKSELESPSTPIIVSSSTPAVEFLTAMGAAAYKYYPLVVVKVGVAALNGVANALVTILVKLPVADGTSQTVEIQGQLTGQFDATIVLYPHLIIQGNPVYTIGKVGGQVSPASEVRVTVTGLPSGASASLLLPLSTHDLFKEMQSKASL